MKILITILLLVSPILVAHAAIQNDAEFQHIQMVLNEHKAAMAQHQMYADQDNAALEQELAIINTLNASIAPEQYAVDAYLNAQENSVNGI